VRPPPASLTFSFPATLDPALFPPPKKSPVGEAQHGVVPPLPYISTPVHKHGGGGSAASGGGGGQSPPSPLPLTSSIFEAWCVAAFATLELEVRVVGGRGGGGGGGGESPSSIRAKYMEEAWIARSKALDLGWEVTDATHTQLLLFAVKCGDYGRVVEQLLAMNAAKVQLSQEMFSLVTSTDFPGVAMDTSSKSTIIALAVTLTSSTTVERVIAATAAAAAKRTAAASLTPPARHAAPISPLPIHGRHSSSPPTTTTTTAPPASTGGGAAPKPAPRKGSVAETLAQKRQGERLLAATSPPPGSGSGCSRSSSSSAVGNGGVGAPPPSPPLNPTPPSYCPHPYDVIFLAIPGLEIALDPLACPLCGTEVSAQYVRGHFSTENAFEFGVPCKNSACTPIATLVPGAQHRRVKLLPKLVVTSQAWAPPLRVQWLPPLVLRREVEAIIKGTSSVHTGGGGGGGGKERWGPTLAATAPSVFFSAASTFKDAGLPTFFLAQLYNDNTEK
jgi:hypothetical protein